VGAREIHRKLIIMFGFSKLARLLFSHFVLFYRLGFKHGNCATLTWVCDPRLQAPQRRSFRAVHEGGTDALVGIVLNTICALKNVFIFVMPMIMTGDHGDSCQPCRSIGA
jgi:hypothetical protein